MAKGRQNNKECYAFRNLHGPPFSGFLKTQSLPALNLDTIVKSSLVDVKGTEPKAMKRIVQCNAMQRSLKKIK